MSKLQDAPDGSGRPVDWQRQWDLFHAAMALDPAARPAFLDSACESDAALRDEIESLLSAHQTSTCLDRPPVCDPSVDVDGLPEDQTENEFTAGEVLAGRFEIVRLVGRGGMGTVYEAVDRELNATVALKTIRGDIARDGGSIERFRREITVARRVTHPNACRIFDLFHHRAEAGQGREVAFLTMELLQGETLSDRIRHAGPFTPAEALPIVEQITDAITAAHRAGVVHRDLKAANVILVEEGGRTRAVITDFGMATLLQTSEHGGSPLTRSGQILGTPEYMAPEQVEGAAVDMAADIYSLGLVLYEMMTGTVPFGGGTPLSIAVRRLNQPPKSPRAHRPDLPRRWERAILWCLERRPEDRPRSAAALLAALKRRGRIAAILPVRASRRRLASALLVSAALLSVVFAWSRASMTPGSGVGGLAFGERDWVLVSAFDNRTGEANLDGTVEFALQRELSNSGFVNVVPRERVADALRLMKLPLDTPLRGDVAREVCLRDGGIQALLRGRVERLGSAYLLSAEISDPQTGVTVAALDEEADGEAAVLAAIRRLSEKVRAALGESAAGIRTGRQDLAAVTTPSLRAVKLYTDADGVLVAGEGVEVAEALLRQAIEEDPEFASAHMLLAFTLRNQGRPRNVYLPHARRAFEMSHTTTERERYFIRGGYYSMAGEDEQAVTNYRALLRLHPDHYWGANNLANTLELGLHQYGELASFARRQQELRPQSFPDQFRAARTVAMYENRPLEARPFVALASALLNEEDQGFGPSWLRLYPVLVAFIERDAAVALEELARIQANAPAPNVERADELYQQMAGWYLALGRLGTAQELFRNVPWSSGPFEIALFRGDLQTLEGLAERSFGGAPSVSRREPLRASLLIRAGRPQAARAVLRAIEKRSAAPDTGDRHPWFEVTPPHVLEILRGELDLAEGRRSRGIERLTAALPRERAIGSASYFLATEALAEALVAAGNADRAMRILEAAADQVGWQYPASAAYWMHVRMQLADVYRSVGRIDDARSLEADLRRLLSQADANHPLVLRLGAVASRSAP